MLFSFREKGQGLVEYSIIIGLVAIVVIAVMTIMGARVKNMFNNLSNSLTM